MVPICTFDPFNKGRHLYTFENICKEDYGLELGDETTKLFLNTKGTLDDVDDETIATKIGIALEKVKSLRKNS